MKRIVISVVLVALLALTFSLTLSADTTQIPNGTEVYAPFVFDALLERSVPVEGSIPNTVIEQFSTPSIRSIELGATEYSGQYYFLSQESADDYGRLTYYIKDEYVFDYGRFHLTYDLAPVAFDINSFINDNSIDDSAGGWVNFLPKFYISTYGVESSITITADLVSIDSAGIARDSVKVRDSIKGTSISEEHTISLAHYLPDFEDGDTIYINQLTISCFNYSPSYEDRYVTGFVYDTFVSPINDDNSPSHVELSSLPLVSILWNSIVDVFEIDLIPGLSLGTILLAIVGLPLLIWFLKLVAGG